VKEAQSLLIAQGKYFGRVDGIRAELTEAAMRSRGEEISRELTNLGLREEALAAGAVTAAAGVAAAATNPAVLQADLADRARKAREATIWVEVMLWVFELARTFGLWALVTTITAKRNLGAVVEGVSDDVPPGHTRVEMPTEQWEAYQKAFEVHGNIRAGAKKGAKTRRQGNKIEAAGEYYRDRISEFMVKHNEGLSTAQIAAAIGLTPASLQASYGAYMTAEEHMALFGPAFVPEPEPEAPVAVADSPQEPTPDNIPPPDLMGEGFTENPEETTDLNGEEVSEDDDLEIPPEPKEWGVAVYDADLKQDDNEGAKRDEMV
jgi:hypothetical protein